VKRQFRNGPHSCRLTNKVCSIGVGIKLDGIVMALQTANTIDFAFIGNFFPKNFQVVTEIKLVPAWPHTLRSVKLASSGCIPVC
jgi:hypothetical protein